MQRRYEADRVSPVVSHRVEKRSLWGKRSLLLVFQPWRFTFPQQPKKCWMSLGTSISSYEGMSKWRQDLFVSFQIQTSLWMHSTRLPRLPVHSNITTGMCESFTLLINTHTHTGQNIYYINNMEHFLWRTASETIHKQAHTHYICIDESIDFCVFPGQRQNENVLASRGEDWCVCDLRIRIIMLQEGDGTANTSVAQPSSLDLF